jgi:hypothetical protein
MNTQELKTSVIANRLVELTTQELFDENAVSLEPENSGRASVIGLEAMQKKEHSFLNAIQQWQKIEVSKPLISNDYFSVKMTVDVILKNGQNIVVNEIIVYQTKNDKIVKELFFY